MMKDVSDLLSPRRQEIDPTRVPYSNEALSADLHRLDDMWEECQCSRERNAIYPYLTAVFDLVGVWEAEGSAQDVARRALRLRLADPNLARDPFATVIFCTSDAEKVDRRTRSKWSRVLQYAAEYKFPPEPLEVFVTKRGGINECAARYAQRLGRHSRKQVNKKRITLADIIRGRNEKAARIRALRC